MRQLIRNALAATSILLCTALAHAKTASEVFEAVSPSIVVVKSYDSKRNAIAFGSGVVFADGAVATNCHVIENAAFIRVIYKDTAFTASANKTDFERDVCTLMAEGLQSPSIIMGSTNRLKVGQRIYAVGAPKGLELTLSDGLISNLRQVEGGKYLQITAPISPGSSGGGLFDAEGRLIGLPTFYVEDGQQLNFAIPVEWIKELSNRQTASLKKKSKKQAKKSSLDWVKGAIALEQKEDWNGYLKHSLLWVKAEPNNADAWNTLGVSYDKFNEISEAINAYQQAIKIYPEFDNAWANLGVAYEKIDQIDKSIEMYRQAISINPDYAKAWKGLGESYTHFNQIQEAIHAYLQAIRISPDYAEAWNNLGLVYLDSKQTAKAYDALQQAVKIKPDYATAWYNLGNVYEFSQSAQAIIAYQEALRLNPNFATAWYNLGVHYKFSGQTSKVMEVYKRLKTIDTAWADSFFNKIVMP